MAKTSLDRKFDQIKKREEEKSFSIKKRSRIVSKFLNNRLAVVGLIIFTIIILASLFAPLLSPYDPMRVDLRSMRQAPSFDHYKDTKIKSPIEYSAIKSGIISIIKYMAKFSKNKNIRFNAISPGGIYANQPKSFLRRYKKDCINKGMLNPEDLVSAFLFLIDDGSKFINGQNIIVDDGWSL